VPHELAIVPVDDRRHERFLRRKILVQRADAYMCRFGDPVGAGFGESVADQDTGSRLDERIYRGA
jgi:hypothetical protein